MASPGEGDQIESDECDDDLVGRCQSKLAILQMDPVVCFSVWMASYVHADSQSKKHLKLLSLYNIPQRMFICSFLGCLDCF